MNQNIKDNIINIVLAANSRAIVKDEQDLAAPLEDIGLDSLDMMSVLFAIQEKYNLEIPDEEIERLACLNLIIEYVEKKSS